MISLGLMVALWIICAVGAVQTRDPACVVGVLVISAQMITCGTMLDALRGEGK